MSHLKMRNFVADEFTRPGSGKITSAEFNVELYEKCLQDHFVRNPALLLAGMNQAVGMQLAPGVGLPLAQGAGTSNGAAAPPTASTNGVEGAEEDVKEEEDINDVEEDELMDEEEPEEVFDFRLCGNNL
ncbi:unnamed protein product [Caenorhabditis nigoni]